jgi:tripartite-type tricarboxylate transporter receptor subunit TctC
MTSKRGFALATLAVVSCLSVAASAQNYPSRPITMIVSAAAGSNGDLVGRIVAQRMRVPLGQPIIIENIGGAEGSLGAGRTARARPDGYTIDIGFLGNHVLNGAVYSLSYDLMNDFATISPLSTLPLFLYARKMVPAKDLIELIAWLKSNPRVSVGSTALGPRLVTAFFQKEIGTNFTVVPYRGNAAVYQDLAAGHIDLFFAGGDGLPLVQAGNIRAYAATGKSRVALAPDLPTFAEVGLPAVFWSPWYGLFAPKGTPKDIIAKLNAAAMEALADPAVQSRLAELGEEVFPREQQTPEALGALVKADAANWWPVIKELGIKAE